MNKPKLNILFAVMLALSVAGCASFYGGVITVTSVVDSAMTSWAELSVAGKTSADLDLKVREAHAKYRIACDVAQKALIAAGDNNQTPDYVIAMTAVRAIADDLIDLIAPLLEEKEGKKLETQLAKASKL